MLDESVGVSLSEGDKLMVLVSDLLAVVDPDRDGLAVALSVVDHDSDAESEMKLGSGVAEIVSLLPGAQTMARRIAASARMAIVPSLPACK